MYNYDYEEDILLTLRLLKFLHGQDPDAAKKIAELFRGFVPEEMYELAELVFGEIFDSVVFDSDPDDPYDELSIVTLTHPAIDCLYELGRRLESARGRFASGWLQKLHDIVEYFVISASRSVYSFDLRFFGSRVELQLRLSPDCYEPILLSNSLVDMLLYVQRENARLEPLVREAEGVTEHEIRKEAM